MSNVNKVITKIQVDRVKTIDELKSLQKLGVTSFSLSSGDYMSDNRVLKFEDIEMLKQESGLGRLGLYFNPNLTTFETVWQLLSSEIFDFVQIEHNTLKFRESLMLRSAFEGKIQFQCASIDVDHDNPFALSFINSDYVKDWGFDQLNLFINRDIQNGWGDFLNGNSFFSPQDLRELKEQYRLAIYSDYDIIKDTNNPLLQDTVLGFVLTDSQEPYENIHFSHLAKFLSEINAP